MTKEFWNTLPIGAVIVVKERGIPIRVFGDRYKILAKDHWFTVPVMDSEKDRQGYRVLNLGTNIETSTDNYNWYDLCWMPIPSPTIADRIPRLDLIDD